MNDRYKKSTCDKYSPAPRTDRREEYEEKIERYREGWRRELEDDLSKGR